MTASAQSTAILTAQDVAEATGENESSLNRREFITYAWGTALVLLMAEGVAVTYFFMMPRFRAGEFGGQFLLGPASTLPTVGSAVPVPNTDGKYWLVQTDEGLKALFMVCTHLGCLYKWSDGKTRFECPCHGSKFTIDGDYIEGPAPRSLDQFEVQVVENGTIVARTQDTPDRIVPVHSHNDTSEFVINTGLRIKGKPAAESPARRV